MARLIPPPGVELPASFGDIDIYLFDRMIQEMWRVLAPEGCCSSAMLIARTGRLGGQPLDPIKTTNVQQQRCMTHGALQSGSRV